MNIRGIILAGGTSSRMGENKLGVMLGGRKIIDHVFDNVKGSNLKDVVVVWGKYGVETDFPKVYNPNYEKGMSTSIIEGLRGYEGDGVMVLLGDMPMVSAEIINKLLSVFENTTKGIVAPCRDGRRGNPVIIGKRYFEALYSNTGDKGARSIINDNEEDIEWTNIDDNGIFVDIDDKIALEKVK